MINLEISFEIADVWLSQHFIAIVKNSYIIISHILWLLCILYVMLRIVE